VSTVGTVGLIAFAAYVIGSLYLVTVPPFLGLGLDAIRVGVARLLWGNYASRFHLHVRRGRDATDLRFTLDTARQRRGRITFGSSRKPSGIR
jgi:hypothetical protein